MTDYLTRMLKLSAIAFFVSMIPVPVLAGSVEITRSIPDGDRVTLKIKVLNDENVPILGLTPQEFKILTTDKNFKPINPSSVRFKLNPPEKQSKPDPAYVILLIDMSGSMNKKEKDVNGNDLSKDRKIDLAVQGIKVLIEQAKQDKIPLKLAIIPFGEGGGSKCEYLVNEKIITDRKFRELTDSELTNQLNQLANPEKEPCAATNLYDPLAEAVKYLGTPEHFSDNSASLGAEEQPQPRLGVILLSDGYHTNRNNEEQQFKDLQSVLKNNPEVTVHTLGYGESLANLVSRAQCKQKLEFSYGQEINVDDVTKNCLLFNDDITTFIVDERRLDEIAKTNPGGIYRHSPDAETLKKSLLTFLTTFSEYELIYRQPGAKRLTRHQTTIQVTSLNLTSEPKEIRVCIRGCHIFDFEELLTILAATLLLFVLGVWLFIQWGKHIKNEFKKGLHGN